MQTHIINLSLENYEETNTYFKIKQNDFGSHKFNFPIVTECDYCIIKFMRPDKSIVVTDTIIPTQNQINYILANSILEIPGLILGEISFYKSGERVTTNMFNFKVLSEINADNAIEEDDRVPILTRLISEVNELKNSETTFEPASTQIFNAASNLPSDDKIYGLKNGEWVENSTAQTITSTKDNVQNLVWNLGYISGNATYGGIVGTSSTSVYSQLVQVSSGDTFTISSSQYNCTAIVEYLSIDGGFTHDNWIGKLTSYLNKSTYTFTKDAIVSFYITSNDDTTNIDLNSSDTDFDISFIQTSTKTVQISEIIPNISLLNSNLTIYDNSKNDFIDTGLNTKLAKFKNFCGKKWCVIGDSITEKNDCSNKNYYEYICDILGMNVQNMGVSGTGYWAGLTTSKDNTFLGRIASVDSDVDFITVMGSLNDFSSFCDTDDNINYTVNEQKLGLLGDCDNSTYYGRIYLTLNGLIEAFPTKPIGIITSTPRQWIHGTTNVFMPCIDAVIKTAESLHIPVLDLYRCCGLRPWNLENRTKFFNSDGVHPIEEGHKLMAHKILSFIIDNMCI